MVGADGPPGLYSGAGSAGVQNPQAALQQALLAMAGGAGLNPMALAALVDLQHQAAHAYQQDAIPLGHTSRSGSYVGEHG